MKILFFVNHLLGIGHLKRVTLLANALASDHKVGIISGGRAIPGLDKGKYDFFQLPSLAAKDESFSELVTDDNLPPDEEYLARRQKIITSTVLEFVPNCIITEHYPYGRKRLKSDFGTFINTALALPQKPLIGASIRDFLVKSDPLTTENFDFLLIHGQPGKSPFIAPLPYYHTGYIHEETPAHDDFEDKILILAGGRQINDNMMKIITEIARMPAYKTQEFVIRGEEPENPPLNCEFIPHLPNLAGGLSKAKLVISEAGYNSFLDAYQADVPTIFVPFHTDKETEQVTRLHELKADNWSEILLPDNITTGNLVLAIRNALSKTRYYNALDLNGLENTKGILSGLLDKA